MFPYLFKVGTSSDNLSFSTFRTWAPMKMPSLSLEGMRVENRVYRCWKAPFLPGPSRNSSLDKAWRWETPLVMFVIDRFQNELFIVIWLLQLDWVDNRNTELFIPIDQEYSLHTSFARVDEKTPNWGKEAKGSEQVIYLWISKTCSLFPNLKCVILTSAVARFYCLSRDVRSSDWCLEKYNSWAKSFESSCKIQWGSLTLAPE